MKGIELINKIKETKLEDCEISVNFSFNGNGAYIAEIKNIGVECTDLNVFIDIGNIDYLINKCTGLTDIDDYYKD